MALAVIIVIAIFLVGYIVYAFDTLPQNTPHEITVSGDGKAYVKPDIALVTFGVTTQALKSQDAVNQNNTKMNAIIAAIKTLGVADKDIQTTLYNLTPVYDYPRILMPAVSTTKRPGIASAPVYMNGERVFSGYLLEQQISVKVRDFSKITDVLDKATSNGATNVGDLQFTIDNPEKIQAEARAEAITKAKQKLQDIVSQSGLQVGKLVNISEGYNNPQPMYAQAVGAMNTGVSVAPQIQPGQQEVDSSVTLTYQVR